MHILVDLDGVVRGQGDVPIAPGVQLIGALSSWNQISYMTGSGTAEVTQWMDQNKIVDFDVVIDSSVGLEGENLKERQVKHARSRGKVDMIITNDPTLWVFAFEQGITALMFGHPAYLRAEFRPDAPKRIRSWDQIQEAVAKQNAVRTQDARLTRTETLMFE